MSDYYIMSMFVADGPVPVWKCYPQCQSRPPVVFSRMVIKKLKTKLTILTLVTDYVFMKFKNNALWATTGIPLIVPVQY